MNDTEETAVSSSPAEGNADGDGVVTVKLYRPLAVNGKELTEIRLDFAGLSKQDFDDIEREMIGAKETAIKNLAFSTIYCMYIAARASGVNRRDLDRLSAKDAYKLVSETQGFFMA